MNNLKKNRVSKEYLRLDKAKINPKTPYTIKDIIIGTKEYAYKAYNVAEKRQYTTVLGKNRKNKYLNIASSKNVIGTINNQSIYRHLE